MFIVSVGLARVLVLEAPVLVMVVLEGNAKAACITVCAEDAGLHLLAVLIQAVEFRGRDLTLDHRGQFVEQGIVEGCVHADRLSLVQSIAADEMGDLLLCPPDLTEGEEVFLPILWANSRMELAKLRAKSGSRYIRVSIRKPSTSYFAIR